MVLKGNSLSGETGAYWGAEVSFWLLGSCGALPVLSPSLLGQAHPAQSLFTSSVLTTRLAEPTLEKKKNNKTAQDGYFYGNTEAGNRRVDL